MKEIRCNLCGSGSYKVLLNLKGDAVTLPLAYKITEDKADLTSLRVVRCRSCGLVYANPQGDPDGLYLRYCRLQDETYAQEEQGRREAARVLLKKLSRYKREGRILDIGCATGFFLDEAQKQGWQAFGVELSQWAAKSARQRFHLEVFEGLLHQANFPYNYFDAIVMFDVLEHLPNPKKTLEEIRRILKPRGVLCISTPDIESFLSKILRARWWGIQQSHIFYFSKDTLNKMLMASGFKVERWFSHARIFSVAYWSRRLGNYDKRLARLFNFVASTMHNGKRLLKINFRDQIEVLVHKRRSLEFVKDDERQETQEAFKGRPKTIVVLPAYNAARTLVSTLKDIPKDLVDDIVLVDDASSDATVEIARSQGVRVVVHERNKGYGANQKTCFQTALGLGADIIIMVHPDYQYDPSIIASLIEPISSGRADAVFGSRMMKGGALEGGMPAWKHNANILLTALENVVLGTYLSEYHSGFRAYSRKFLETVAFKRNSDDFVFDTEIIVQGLMHYLKIEEVPIKTRYFEEASTIRMFPAVTYGLGILLTLVKYFLHTKGYFRFAQFE